MPAAKLVLEDFDQYEDDASLRKCWYSPRHGGDVSLSLAPGKGALQVEFTTEPIEGRSYCAICRLAHWRVEKPYDALEFWVKPDGSGQPVNIELNMANSPRPETHDLFGFTVNFDLDDDAPRVVSIPLEQLRRPKWQAGLGLYPDFRLGDVFEVALYFGGDRRITGSGVYLIDDIALTQENPC